MGTMTLRRCKQCGLPRKLASDFIWPGDGTIYAGDDPSMRMIFIESDYLSNLWYELETALGLPVADAVLKRQHMAVRYYQEENVLPEWRRYALRHLPVRLLSRSISKEVAIYGIGTFEFVEYRRGKMVVIRVRRPYDIVSVAGGVRGISESIEGKKSEVAWTRENGDYIITVVFKPVSPGDQMVELESRIEEDEEKVISEASSGHPSIGHEAGKRCSSCGLPLNLNDLRWRDWEGTIVHRHRENRYVFFSGYILQNIIVELERITGRDLGPLVMDISKDFVRQHVRHMPIGDMDAVYQEFSRNISMSGFGEVVSMNRGESHLEMVIQNPYFPPLLAGSVMGIFEHVEGELAAVDFHTPSSRLLELRIRTT
jgi:hypothetical protein